MWVIGLLVLAWCQSGFFGSGLCGGLMNVHLGGGAELSLIE